MIVNSVLWISLNIILISVPEHIFIVLFTLALMERYDDFLRPNIKKISTLLLPIMVPSVISNLIRANSGYATTFMPVIGILVITSMFIVAYQIKNINEIIKSLLCVALAAIIIMIFQLAYLQLVTYSTSISVETFSRPGLINLIFSLPERVVETLLILCLVSKKNRVKANMLEIIFKKPLYITVAAIVLSINLMFIYIFSVLIIKNNMLFEINTILQLTILTTIMLFPIVNMSMFFYMIYFLSYKNIYENKFIKTEMYALKSSVKLLYENGDYQAILSVVDDFSEFLESQEEHII